MYLRRNYRSKNNYTYQWRNTCKLLWNVNRMQWDGYLRLCCHKHFSDYLVRNQSFTHTFWFLGMFFAKTDHIVENSYFLWRNSQICTSKCFFRIDICIFVSAVAKPGRIYSTTKWRGMFSFTFIRHDDIYNFAFPISPNFSQFVFPWKLK